MKMTYTSKHSQCNEILNYMRLHPSINAKIARNLFRCERLASRINDLKNKGYKIGTNIVTYKDEDGITIRYAEYFLEEAI